MLLFTHHLERWMRLGSSVTSTWLDAAFVAQGGVEPRPIKENKLEPTIVIDLWGGPNDQCTNPMNNPNRALTFGSRPETQAASNYFAPQKANVTTDASTPRSGAAERRG